MLKRFIKIIILCLLPTIGIANISPAGFEEFPNYYFVETGTYLGKGIRFALRAQFAEIHSIEINPLFVAKARKLFVGYTNVHVWQGDSSSDLWNIIKNLDQQITFWLDGHCGSPRKDGGKNTPLIDELEQIKMHPIKTHTILIDDMHCCNTILFDWLSKDDIKQKILEINPNYRISFIDGGDRAEYKNNVMVAQVFE